MWKLFAIILLRSASDLSFKGAISGCVGSDRSPIGWVVHWVSRPLLWVGLVLGTLNVVVWSSALKTFDLSYAYPFLSFSYVTIILGGRLFFNETLDRYKTIGVCIITMGSLLLLFQ